MVVVIKNYVVKLSYTVPEAPEAITFVDSANTFSWVKEAVKSTQQTGILVGRMNNRFDSTGAATGAEVATVLWWFVEIIADPQTANG